MVVLSFAIICAVAFGAPLVRNGRTDFLSFYSGARLVGTGDLYSAESAHQIQQDLSRPDELQAYIRAPFYAVLLWPLGQLPYLPALYLWQLLNIAALAGFVLIGSGRALAAVVCCWFFPTWMNFAISQDMPLVLLAVAGAIWFLRRDRALLAGIVLSLCAVTFHLFLLVPVLILSKRMWRFAGGLALGGLPLTMVSFAAGGANWPIDYYHLLWSNEQNQASERYMANLNGLFHQLPYSTVWLAAGTIGVVLATWWMARKTPPEVALPIALCGGLLVSVHAFTYDCMIVLPLMFVLLERMGARPVLIVSGLLSLAALMLGAPRISFVGQLLLVFLFVLLVARTPLIARPAGGESR